MSEGTDRRTASRSTLDPKAKVPTDLPADRDHGNATPTTPETALREEVAAAERLLESQTELWDAMRTGAPPQTLEPILERHRRSVENAGAASQTRRYWFDGPGSLEQWITKARPGNAEEIRRLAAQGTTLRSEIIRLVQRSAFLARKTASWYESQTALIVDWVSRQSGASTYAPSAQRQGLHPASGTGPGPTLLDRSA